MPASPRYPIPYPVYYRVMTEYAYRCAYCGDAAVCLDHVIPLCQGGDPKDPDNTVPACKSCNSGKRGDSLLDWVSRGFLIGWGDHRGRNARVVPLAPPQPVAEKPCNVNRKRRRPRYHRPVDALAEWTQAFTESARRHRRKKRQDGECGYNGCHVKTEAYLCDPHAAKNKEAVRKYRANG